MEAHVRWRPPHRGGRSGAGFGDDRPHFKGDAQVLSASGCSCSVSRVDKPARCFKDPGGLPSGADGGLPVGMLPLAGVRARGLLREQHLHHLLEAVFANPALYPSGETAHDSNAHSVGLLSL